MRGFRFPTLPIYTPPVEPDIPLGYRFEDAGPAKIDRVLRWVDSLAGGKLSIPPGCEHPIRYADDGGHESWLIVKGRNGYYASIELSATIVFDPITGEFRVEE